MGGIKLRLIKKYCNCCSLKIGIYIKNGVNLTLGLAAFTLNFILLFSLLSFLHDRQKYLDILEENLDIDLQEASEKTVQALNVVLTCHFFIWVLCKFSFLICLALVIYAIIKRKVELLKLFLYVSIPKWIYDMVVIITMIHFTGKVQTSFMILAIFFEAYLIFAIKNLYHKMYNESQLTVIRSEHRCECIVYANGFVSTNRISLNNDDAPHCSTCTCALTPILSNIPAPTINTSTVELATGENSVPEPKEELNFKEDTVIYDENQLTACGSAVFEDVNTNDLGGSSSVIRRRNDFRAVRPTTLNLNNNNDIEEKQDLAAVIFDENQLNVGVSPVVENLRIVEDNGFRSRV